MNLKVCKVLGDQSYFLSSLQGVVRSIGLGDGRFTVQTHVSLNFAIQKHGLKFVPFHLAALIQMVLLQTIQCEAFCFHVFQQLLNKWEKRGNG